MTHLKAVSKKAGAWPDGFPFNVPTIAVLPRLEFARPVTILVGENGSGKSTLLEALAAGTNLVALGGSDLERDDTLHAARALATHLRFEWSKRTLRGFFLRAEDVFNFVRRVNQEGRELQTLADSYEADTQSHPHDPGPRRARGYILGQKAALVQRYGENADARSHGETFLHLFQERIKPNGLYLPDEPEAALSPARQLAFLSLMKSAVAEGAQFIMATHSPILMACPQAQIWNFDVAPIALTTYEELEGVALLRAFLGDPEAFTRRL